jgi:hypothetical protein
VTPRQTEVEREGVRAQYGQAWLLMRRRAAFEREYGTAKEAQKLAKLARRIHNEMSEAH